MRNAKRTQSGIVSVDGDDFEWRIHREPQWCTADGWRGLAIAVHHVDGRRQALIEWPMPREGSLSVPYRQRPKIDSLLLIQGVRSALAAGWEPLSKGKAFRVLV